MKRVVGRGIVVLGWLLLPASATGQPAPSSRFARPPVAPSQPPQQDRTGSLEGHLALAVAERLLASDNSDDRVRAVERLAGSGQREGVERLLRALADGGSALRDPRARLAAIRGLFPYASREPVRQAMEKALTTEAGASPLLSLARDTAAMALAASDDARSLGVLRAALRQGGATGDAAELALLAYPPASLSPLGVGSGDLPASVCDLLGRLGDERAVGALRGTLVRGLVRAATLSDEPAEPSFEDQSRLAKVAAALALARLGDQEQVPVARSWMASGDAALKLIGAEILLLSGASDARRALLPLLAAPATRAPAFRLAARSPGPELLTVAGEAAGTSDDTGTLALFVLGRLGGASAVSRLEALLRNPARAWDAAFALARAPGDEARRALEAAQSNPALLRLAARAGIVRVLTLGDEPHHLGDTLRALFASKDPADRAAGAFGLAALGKTPASELIASRDLVVVRAAARASLVLEAESSRAMAERLAVESDGGTRTALALALAHSTDGLDALSTHQLLSWAEGDEPIAPLSIVALGEREQPGEERRLARWLESEDPVRRVHAAFALGSSPLASAAGRLADAWRFEPDRAVRRAIIVALAQRSEPSRLAALGLAARLDPDTDVRESAGLGLLGRLPSPIGHGREGCSRGGSRVSGCHVAWISLVPSAPAPASAVSARAGSLVDASGLSLPVVSDPDGVLVVPGIWPGDASFRLASSGIWYEAPGHDRSEAGSAR
jgi:HEAT repeats